MEKEKRGKGISGGRIGILLYREEDVKRFEALRKRVQKELGVGRLSRSQFVMYMVSQLEERT
ncbi:hypothetical protein [Hydrogenivirga sp.]